MQRIIRKFFGLNRLQMIWAKANDIYLRIETNDRLPQEVNQQKLWPYAKPDKKAKYQGSIVYQAADYLNIRRMLRVLRPNQNDVFYDIGCGKGRVICMVAHLSLRRVVGIELQDFLCEVARRNVERLRGRKATLEIRCEDAAKTDLSDGTIYFMYNPFGEETMQEVLSNIERSLSINPRRIKIVYYNPFFEKVFRASGWLRGFYEFKTLTGRRVVFYESIL